MSVNTNEQWAEDELGAITSVSGERTVEGRVARTLRELITSGRLDPGLRLRYRDLATRFDVSVTPVRIALRDLSKEGLVEIAPRGVVRVTPLSREEIEEIYAARAGLEGLLAKVGAENIADQTLAEMWRLLGELKAIAIAEDRWRYLEQARAYRLACYESAKRPRLLKSVLLLVQRSARYSALTLGEFGRFDESIAYLERLFDACERRDGEAAEAITRESMDWSRSYLTGKYAATLVTEVALGRGGSHRA